MHRPGERGSGQEKKTSGEGGQKGKNGGIVWKGVLGVRQSSTAKKGGENRVGPELLENQGSPKLGGEKNAPRKRGGGLERTKKIGEVYQAKTRGEM